MTLFPPEAIEILAGARWSPDAKRHFDAMSGGFYWSDECWDAAIDACMEYPNYAFRELLAYRASLINGEPRAKYQDAWEQVKAGSPSWPGFRAERVSAVLARDLEQANRVMLRRFDRLEKEFGDDRRPPN